MHTVRHALCLQNETKHRDNVEVVFLSEDFQNKFVILIPGEGAGNCSDYHNTLSLIFFINENNFNRLRYV